MWKRLSLRCIPAASVALFLSLVAAQARAASVYYRVPLKDVKFTQGELPTPPSTYDWRRGEAMRPWARVEGGEAYVEYLDKAWNGYNWSGIVPENVALVVRAEAGKDVLRLARRPKVRLEGDGCP